MNVSGLALLWSNLVGYIDKYCTHFPPKIHLQYFFVILTCVNRQCHDIANHMLMVLVLPTQRTLAAPGKCVQSSQTTGLPGCQRYRRKFATSQCFEQQHLDKDTPHSGRSPCSQCACLVSCFSFFVLKLHVSSALRFVGAMWYVGRLASWADRGGIC